MHCIVKTSSWHSYLLVNQIILMLSLIKTQLDLLKMASFTSCRRTKSRSWESIQAMVSLYSETCLLSLSGRLQSETQLTLWAQILHFNHLSAFPRCFDNHFGLRN